MNKVYYLDINKFKKEFLYEEIYKQVSSYRKAKTDNLKFEKDKWLSLGAEYLLIQGLKEFKIDYSKIEIELVKNNKPMLKNCSKKIFFNLSHSEDMAMCVISDCEVGCDIQKKSETKNYMQIANRFFHPEEIKMIENSDEKKELFYRIWVLKESYIKATGNGFRTPLKDFKISLEKNKPALYINDHLEKKFVFEEKQTGNKEYKSAICLNMS